MRLVVKRQKILKYSSRLDSTRGRRREDPSSTRLALHFVKHSNKLQNVIDPLFDGLAERLSPRPRPCYADLASTSYRPAELFGQLPV
jgi:hypothetical protein